MRSSMFDKYAQEIQEMLTAKMYYPEICEALNRKYPNLYAERENLRIYCVRNLYVPAKPRHKNASLAEELTDYADRIVQDCERIGATQAYRHWRYLDAVNRRGLACFQRAVRELGYDAKTVVERQLSPYKDDFQRQIDAGMTYQDIRRDFERYHNFRYSPETFKKWLASHCDVDGKRCQKGGSRSAKPWKRKVQTRLF